MKKPHDPDEILAVVDDNDEVIGRATRKEIHDRGLLHREVYVFLINSRKQVLLHKRSDVGLWDASSSGHFPLEQDYLEGARREFEEELGIKLETGEFIEAGKEKLILAKYRNIRFATVFLIYKDIPLEDFDIDSEEIEEIRYFDKGDLLKLFSNHEKMTTGSAKTLIEKYVLDKL